ncbi:CAZyme family AA7 [Penicillium roqueforti]|nr:CAZyme family AA7 [Penicillium roqueforti]KAI3155763.1 CAZyme family AA7 [Penicillium roqueforti]
MQLLLPFVGLSLSGLAYANSSSASASATVTGFLSTSSGTLQVPKGASCACEKLSRSMPKSIILPGATNYTTQTVDNYWDIRANLSPACVFVPNTAAEVSQAVKIIGACDAQFAVRGGGHMNYPGANNIDAGDLIALSNLNSITVKSNTVEVGPGLNWYEVDSALEPHGRVCIGGRMKTIGVPGLSLIGGFHYFNNKYGYAMDNVVTYDIVLGNGTQITVNKTLHSDLFWALKGGANNFGIVTRFELKTYDIPKISTTIQVFNETHIPDYISAVCEAAKLDDEDPIAAGMIATITYNATTKVAQGSVLGVQEGVSSPPSQFANFTKIPATQRINNVTTIKPWVEVLDSPKQMMRVQFSHKTMKPDAEVLYSIYKAWKAAVDKIADVQGLYPTFVMNVISPTSVRVAKTNGVGNVWGLEEEPLIIWQLSTGWDLAQDDIRMEAWARQLVEHLHGINKELGLASEFIYMGDAGEWQDPYAGFPSENVARMRKIRSSYDPAGVFSILSWGGFKLGL